MGCALGAPAGHVAVPPVCIHVSCYICVSYFPSLAQPRFHGVRWRRTADVCRGCRVGGHEGDGRAEGAAFEP
eukprot:2504996-Rhodomonas_salina.1